MIRRKRLTDLVNDEALMKLEYIFQHEHAMAKKLCNKKHGVEIKLIN